MKVLFLTKYGWLGASSRYRTLQYIPYLEKHGFQCDVAPLFDNSYLRVLYTSRKKSAVLLARALGRRLWALLRAATYDLIVIEYEIVPYAPPLLEHWLTRRGIPYVLDYDDAIFHHYDQYSNGWMYFLLRNKVLSIIAGAALFIAGNEYLATYARQVSDRVVVLPTVVDLQRYPWQAPPREGPFTVGWIGTPLLAPVYLSAIAPTLQRFFSYHPGRLMLVGAGEVKLPGVPLETYPWSEATEVALLQQFHVGIMPLPDTPFEQGKCGLKLIQYMACGRPVIASPVGVNIELVRHGNNGFLATSQDEWLVALTTLSQDADLRAQMGRAGRELVAQKYCLDVAQVRMVELLKAARA